MFPTPSRSNLLVLARDFRWFPREGGDGPYGHVARVGRRVGTSPGQRVLHPGGTSV